MSITTRVTKGSALTHTELDNNFYTLDANDYLTYSTLNANSYNSYTTLNTRINTVNSNVASLPNSAANDYATYSTLNTRINTVNSNVASVDNNTWVNANDYNSYTTLSGRINTVNSNVEALPNSAANDYLTYTTVVGLVDLVQDNVYAAAASYLSSNLTDLSNGVVPSNLVPSANAVYDLGSPDMWFKDLYLSGNTLYMAGQAVLSMGANGLVFAANLAPLSATQKSQAFYGTTAATGLSGAIVTGTVVNLTYSANNLAGYTDFNASDYIKAPNKNNLTSSVTLNGTFPGKSYNGAPILGVGLGDYVGTGYNQTTSITVNIGGISCDPPNQKLDIITFKYGYNQTSTEQVLDTVTVSNGYFSYSTSDTWQPGFGNASYYLVQANPNNTGFIRVDWGSTSSFTTIDAAPIII